MFSSDAKVWGFAGPPHRTNETGRFSFLTGMGLVVVGAMLLAATSCADSKSDVKPDASTKSTAAIQQPDGDPQVSVVERGFSINFNEFDSGWVSMGVVLENTSDFPVSLIAKSRLVDKDGEPVGKDREWTTNAMLTMAPNSKIGAGSDSGTGISKQKLDQAVDFESSIEAEWEPVRSGAAFDPGELQASNVNVDTDAGARGADRVSFDVHSTFSRKVDSLYTSMLVRDKKTGKIIGGAQPRMKKNPTDRLRSDISCPPGDSEATFDVPYQSDISDEDIEVYLLPEPYPTVK